MHPTLSPGDICLAIDNQKYQYEDIENGTIVFLKHKYFSYVLTKRIIARENDTVSIKGTETRIDGVVVPESYAYYSGPSGIVEMDSIVVNPNSYFVMGDNRMNSQDSRDSEFGLIHIKNITGRPLIILWSDNFQKIFNVL